MDIVFKREQGIFNYRVAGVLIKDGHVLIHKNVDDSFWALPGGRVKISEEAQIGLQREFQEELGIDVQIERLLWSVENFFEYNDTHFHEIGFYYQVTANDDYEVNAKPFYGIEGERLIYKWIPISQLDKVKIYPEFLKSEIKDTHNCPKHIVVRL
ncbi:NUDIX hydrolase [Rummeliibacillus sp. POC4]|uniref:NUDIX hydrolase n=1 Tax=Rummeliibacillus sp. POC4 TaxID=2305899 RepID=UPI000E6740F6|nr:NUDIX hydrolase [Rummeliibacillus sp. POC4]RIJ66973.1 NUDIX domain-containing protein [Rummeliibacillus sp. POC4]